MAINPDIIHNPWVFDDTMRRMAMRLFDDSISPKRAMRNRQYREGLMKVVEGCATENKFDIDEGIAQINAVFSPPSVQENPLYQETNPRFVSPQLTTTISAGFEAGFEAPLNLVVEKEDE